MSDVDVLLLRLRSDVPELTEDDVERIARRVLDGQAASSRGWRAGRGARLIKGTALATGLTAALGAVIMVGRVHRSAPQTSVPRASWGLTLTVRVVAEPGTDPAVATERAAAALAARSRSEDVPGLAVSRVQTGQLLVRVPGVVQPEDAANLIATGPVSVHAGSERIAHWTTATEMFNGLRGFPGKPQGYIVMGRPGLAASGDAVGFRVGDFRRSRREADRALAVAGTETFTVVPLPEGIRLVLVGDEGPSVDAYRSSPPLISAGEIDSVEQLSPDNGGTRLALTVSAAARGRLPSRDDPLVAVQWQGPEGIALGPVTRDGSRLSVTVSDSSTPGPEQIVTLAGQPPVPARLIVTGSQPFGRRPPLVGEPVVNVPPGIAAKFAKRGWKRPTPIVRVLSAPSAQGQVALYVARRPNGRDDVWVVDGLPGEGGCTDLPGPPALGPCSAMTASTQAWVGRVGDPSIRRVTVAYDDTKAYPAVVASGWFMAVIPSSSSAWPIVRGYDRSGEEVARAR